MKNLILSLTFGIISFSVIAQSADSANRYYLLASKEKNARRYAEAEKLYSRSYKFDQKNVDVLYDWATVLIAQKRFRDAQDKLEKADRLNPKHEGVLENLAVISVNSHQWQRAIQYAQRFQQLNTKKPMSYLLAKSYYELENFGESIKYCELAFKEEPKRAEIPYIAGRCFMEMSNYRRAAGCYEQALAIDSSNSTWMYEAGLMWYAVPDDKKAIYWIEKAGDKGYKKSNDYYENLSNAYLNIGNYPKGIELLKEVLKNKPEDREILYNVAEAYYKSKKYQEAIDFWDKLLTLDPKNAHALYMIGMSYQKKGDKQKGMQLCDKAIDMDPSLKNLREEIKRPDGI
jgi:tetratricopeptide (TPR) repeat protein